jgi:translation initiation factor 1
MPQSRPVYSTAAGRLCPDCGKAVAACTCRTHAKQQVKGDGSVRVSRETKGRGGKGVTLITGLPLADEALKELASKLKQTCGTGGTVKEGVIEIQGDHREKLCAYLLKAGYKAKLAGG